MCKEAGLIPGLLQWVKHPARPWAVVWVTDVAQIWCCCGCGPAAAVPNRSLAWELPHATGAAVKRKKKKKKKKKKYSQNLITDFFSQRKHSFPCSRNAMITLWSKAEKLENNDIIFSSCTHGIWKFLGQGLNPSRSCNLRHGCGNASSLTHFATAGSPVTTFWKVLAQGNLNIFH